MQVARLGKWPQPEPEPEPESELEHKQLEPEPQAELEPEAELEPMAECVVCFCDEAAERTLRCREGHALCADCAIRYTEVEMGPAELGKNAGLLRCPVPECAAAPFLEFELNDAARRWGRPGLTESYARGQHMLLEKLVMASALVCPACSYMVLVDTREARQVLTLQIFCLCVHGPHSQSRPLGTQAQAPSLPRCMDTYLRRDGHGRWGSGVRVCLVLAHVPPHRLCTTWATACPVRPAVPTCAIAASRRACSRRRTPSTCTVEPPPRRRRRRGRGWASAREAEWWWGRSWGRAYAMACSRS
eukprot:COSAG01_NODE_5924_length_3949_cov_7.064675_2_plen_302_part_00